MVSSEVNELASKIRDFVKQTGSCLFAGSGVGQKAGLPTWKDYLEYLASVAIKYEQETADLMFKRISSGLYLEAADLYKMCPMIPKGEKYKHIASPFLNYSANELHSLMALPFSAVVTTNYDRSLHDAYFNLFQTRNESGLNLKSPNLVKLGDMSMKKAPFWTNFYIARIHGRSEIPETIVLTTEDYLNIERDASYQDFLVNIFKNYKCLFLGYSFLDPAIDRVLRLMDKTLPQPHSSLHIAIIPDDCDQILSSKLANFNIQVIRYNSINKHEILWASIKAAQRDVRTKPRESTDKIELISGLHRFLACCYSRMKLGKRTEPLREIVVQGIITQSIIDAGPSGISKKELVQSLKKYISLDDSQLSQLVNEAVQSLVSNGICSENQQKRINCNFEGQKPYDTVIEKLVDGIIYRLSVREGVNIEPSVRTTIVAVLNRIFLTRGWDLGAHFAGGNPFNTFHERLQIQNLVENFSKDLSPTKFKPLSNAILSLFRYPDDNEVVLLADIGRIAFGVELVLNNARSTIEQSLLLPNILYLDASVLMPAIVNGHPYGPIYFDAISRMQDVSKKAGRIIEARIANIFLEEIIHHRFSAINEVKDQFLENPDELRDHILLWGAESTNVFIGAYASWVGRSNKKIAFSKFLQEAAPYATEEALEKYINDLGIRTIRPEFLLENEKKLFNEVVNALYRAYEELETDTTYSRKKPKILIDHEAIQLTQLIIDIKSGKNPLFVTADKRLMSMLNNGILELCTKAVVSQIGLIQLIDLVIGLGINADKRALARLMWSVELSDEKAVIRNYLIDLALQYYDEAKAMAMWEVVDELTEKASAEAREQGLSMHMKISNRTDRGRVAKFLDRFESDFFKKMDEVIRLKKNE